MKCICGSNLTPVGSQARWSCTDPNHHKATRLVKLAAPVSYTDYTGTPRRMKSSGSRGKNRPLILS